MARLTITDRRERALVAAADALLWPAGLRRLFHRRLTDLPRRILCLRLERIGDLLMTGPALADLLHAELFRLLFPEPVVTDVPFVNALSLN